MGVAFDIVLFVVAGAVSLEASSLLIVRLECLADHLHVSEALLGLVAAVAADMPELTSAVTALIRGQHSVGVGVALGSNVFNLAALLGLSAVIAGRLRLHRRVIVLGGSLAMLVSGSSVAVVAGALSPVSGAAVSLVALGAFALLASSPTRTTSMLRIPPKVARWLVLAVHDEEAELRLAEEPRQSGPWRSDAMRAGGALAAVVVASAVMEQTATSLGAHWHVPGAIVGGVVLAAVTSLPNAVVAVHLARRARGAATLSESLNSNTVNATFGFLVPSVFLGVGRASGPGLLTASWAVGLTGAALLLAYTSKGLGRRAGVLVIAGYVAFVVALVLTS